MLHKRHNSVVTLAVLLTLVGVSKPAKAFLLAQSDTAPTTFTVPDKLSEDAAVRIAASNSADNINNSLEDSFAAKYPQAEVNVETQDSGAALKSVSDGRADIAAIGRNLTAEEQAEGFTAVPVSREKIAIVVSPENSYDGNLTIEQFAQIFRGEITDWAEIGGTPGRIELVDLPENNDTRQAFPNYPVFQAAEFTTGDTATQLEQDSTEAAIAQLGENGISYAVANDVINRDDVKIVTMHQTQPDDPRYPFSQPFNLVYQGTPSEAAEAYMAYATAEGGQEVVANRIGSVATATAIAAGTASNVAGKVNAPEIDPDANANANADSVDGEANLNPNVGDTDVEGEVNPPNADADNVDGDDALPEADANAENAEADLDPDAIADARVDGNEGSGELNPDVEGSGELNSDLNGSGETNADLNDSGEVNVDLDDSGEVNVDLDDSGELNPDVEDSGEALPADPEAVEGGEVVVPNDGGDGTEVAENEGGKWWLLLIPLLAIPLLAAMFLGGRKKSDREPAVDNVPPNVNSPGSINPNRPDGGGVPPVGANVSGNLGNANNTVNTASSMGAAGLAAGGAALAGGAAANVAGNRRVENSNDVDLNLDDSVTAEEIPSTPVTEFTGQETRLQVEDTESELQNEDIDLDRSEFGNGLNSAAGIGGVASDFDRNLNNDSVVESPDANAELDLDANRGGLTADSDADISTRNLNSEFNPDDLDADAEGEEFLGDFVLPEEGRDISVTNNLNVDNNVDRGTGIVDGATDVGGAALGSAASGFFNREDGATNAAEIEVDADEQNRDLDFNSDLNLSDRPERSANLTGDIIEVEAANFDTETDRADSSLDTDLDIDGDTTSELNSTDIDADTNVDSGSTGNAVIAGGAALGGAAAVSGFFNRDREENAAERIDSVSDRVDLDSDLDVGDRSDTSVDLAGDNLEVGTPNLDAETNVIDLRSDDELVDSSSTDINLDDKITSELDSTDVDLNLDSESSEAIITGSTLDTEVDAAELDRDANLDLDLSDRTEDVSANLMGGIGEVKTSNLDTGIDATDRSQDLDFNLDDDTSELDLSSIDTDIDLNLDDESGIVNETTADTEVNTTNLDRDNDLGFLSDLDLDDSNNTSADLDFNLDDDTSELDLSSFDTDSNLDAGIIGGAALGGAALGGAAASGLNRDTERTAEIQEFETFETSFDVSADSQTSSFADNVIADAETTAIDDNDRQEMTIDGLARSEDVTLDEITFNDEERTINASLEDISFDDAESEEINLDEITLDDNEINLDSPTEDLTPSGRYEDIRLEDLGFADAEPIESPTVDLENNVTNGELVDDRSDDMNNISQWLDSLETNQDSDNISNWLDTLDRDSPRSDADLSDSNRENIDLTEEEDDISFQFLEDLLDRDEDSNRDR